MQNGSERRVTIALARIDDPCRARRRLRFGDALARRSPLALLVVDPTAYLLHGPDAGNVLLHLVNERHARS